MSHLLNLLHDYTLSTSFVEKRDKQYRLLKSEGINFYYKTAQNNFFYLKKYWISDSNSEEYFSYFTNLIFKIMYPKNYLDVSFFINGQEIPKTELDDLLDSGICKCEYIRVNVKFRNLSKEEDSFLLNWDYSRSVKSGKELGKFSEKIRPLIKGEKSGFFGKYEDKFLKTKDFYWIIAIFKRDQLLHFLSDSKRPIKSAKL